MEIKEGSLIKYRDFKTGDILKGKVSQVYRSVTGNICVHLTSGVCIKINEVIL